jgi:hypothetical protein
VCSRDLEHEEAKALYRALKIQTKWVVTPGIPTKNFIRVFANIWKQFIPCSSFSTSYIKE